jgi:hypothetical protein
MNKGIFYVPHLKYAGKTHNTKGKMMGMGYVPPLLDNGGGTSNSYSSIDDYMMTTGKSPTKGLGLSKSFTDKLSNLNMSKPTSKKPKNINFTL